MCWSRCLALMGEAEFVVLDAVNLLPLLQEQELCAKHAGRAQILDIDYSTSKISSALGNNESEKETQAKKPMI